MATPLPLLDTDGVQHLLGAPASGPVLAAFFKTTCPTCMLTFRYLERIHQAYTPYGATVWGISQDGREESLAWAAHQEITFPILLDTDWVASLAYELDYVPTMFLFDRSGQIVHISVSFLKTDLNEMALLIAEETHSAPVEIAPSDDGKPSFRPG